MCRICRIIKMCEKRNKPKEINSFYQLHVDDFTVCNSNNDLSDVIEDETIPQDISAEEILLLSYQDAIKSKNLAQLNELIDSDSSKKDIPLQLYHHKCLTPENLRFILRHERGKFRVSTKLIRTLIHHNHVSLLDVLLQNISFYTNEFIIKFCILSRNTINLSRSDFDSLVMKSWKKYLPTTSQIYHITPCIPEIIQESECSILMHSYDLPNTVNKYLYQACAEGNELLVRFLVRHGFDVNKAALETNGYRFTPLIAACQYGHEAIVKYLVGHGAVINKVKGININSPLTSAYEGDHDTIIDYLMEHKVCYCLHPEFSVESIRLRKKKCLIQACQQGNLAQVKFLIENGKKAVFYFNLNHALTEACLNNHEAIVKYLMKLNINLFGVTPNRNTPLSAAFKSNNATIVRYIINNGLDPYQEDYFGKSALTYARNSDNKKIFMNILVERGSLVNFKNDNGETPLFNACRYGDRSFMEILVENGANVNQQNSKKDTPIFYACEHGYEAMVTYLVEHGADLNHKNAEGHTPLYYSYIKTMNETITNYLIHHGADLHHQKDCNGETALFYACNYESETMVNYLIDHEGMDVNQKNFSNEIPLHIACQKSNEAIVRTLLEHGSDRNLKDNCGKTPLINACLKGNEPIVRLLVVEYGVDPNQADNSGKSSLFYAFKFGNEAIVQLLIEHGATDLSQPYYNGKTPLIYACQKGFATVVKSLIDRGVDLGQEKDDQGELLLMVAYRLRNGRIIKDLIRHGVNINRKNLAGNTLFYEACEQGDLNLVKYLIRYGADITIKGRNGKVSPMYAAKFKKNYKIVEYLNKHSMKI
eukprot:jgi/Orpsp1_1/1180820/evm.model.c7180000074765.1